MADKKISALTSSTVPLAGTEVLPIVQSNSTVKVSVENLTAGRAINASSVTTTGNITSTTGNFVIDTTSKGITTNGSDTLGFGTNGSTTQMSLYPSNQLALNTTTISTGIFTVNTTALPGVDIFRSDASANYSGIRFRDETNANTYAQLGWDSTGLRLDGVSGAVYLSSSGTERLTITGTNGDATVKTGNLVVGTAGKGIDFSANTHAAGMTSELLNDYEEGTWTPNQGAGLTVNGTFSSDGTYTKVGRLVSIHGRIGASVSLSASGALCSNLPYSPASNSTGTYLTGAAAAAGVLWAGGSAIYTVSPGISSTTDVWFCLTYQI